MVSLSWCTSFFCFSDVDSPKLGAWECPRLAKVMQILIPSVEHGRTLSSLVKDKYGHWKEALERTSQNTDDSPLSLALYVPSEADGLLISFFCAMFPTRGAKRGFWIFHFCSLRSFQANKGSTFSSERPARETSASPFRKRCLQTRLMPNLWKWWRIWWKSQMLGPLSYSPGWRMQGRTIWFFLTKLLARARQTLERMEKGKPVWIPRSNAP